MIAVAEIKGVLPAADPHFGHDHAHGHATDEEHDSEPDGDAVPVPGE
jgi:hypothetical protein